MTALLVVANQHGLNPWTNEIYAFPNNGGIVPIVGADGWSRIMKEHPQFDGIVAFGEDNSCTCTIYRKDRTRPTIVTEYLSECQRNTQPWKSHPKRMLRHKAMIQGARLAFGFTGIYDPDEGERIAENQRTDVTPKPNVIDVQGIELITPEQRQQIDKLIELTQSDVTKALAYYGVESLDKLSKVAAENFIKKLNTKLDEANQRIGDEIAGVSAYTRDTQTVTTALTISYKLTDPVSVYKNFRTTENMAAQLIEPRSRQALEVVFSNYSAQKALENRAQLSTDIS